jgi:DNA-binding NarL/FixJ family response regulator
MNDRNHHHIMVGMVDYNCAYAKLMEETLQQCPDLVMLKVWNELDTAMREIPEQGADILIMDIQWPGNSGIEYMKKMKMICSGLHFLVHTRCDEDDKIFAALRAGASGYLLKGESQETLIRAIRDIHAGGAPMSHSVSRKVVNSFSRKQLAGSCLEQLTRRETEVLALLAEGKMYKEVSITLGIEMETTKKHIRNIYGKLQVQNRTEAVNKWRLPGYYSMVAS